MLAGFGPWSHVLRSAAVTEGMTFIWGQPGGWEGRDKEKGRKLEKPEDDENTGLGKEEVEEYTKWEEKLLVALRKKGSWSNREDRWTRGQILR